MSDQVPGVWAVLRSDRSGVVCELEDVRLSPELLEQIRVHEERAARAILAGIGDAGG